MASIPDWPAPVPGLEGGPSQPTARLNQNRRLIEGSLSLCLWMYVVLLLLASFASPVRQFDDSLPLLHGALITQGRTPNLDFYSFYPPLGLHINAAAFKFVGKSVMTTRIFAVGVYVVVLLLAGRLFRKTFSRVSRTRTGGRPASCRIDREDYGSFVLAGSRLLDRNPASLP